MNLFKGTVIIFPRLIKKLANFSGEKPIKLLRMHNCWSFLETGRNLNLIKWANSIRRRFKLDFS